jgi:peroxiredoxin
MEFKMIYNGEEFELCEEFMDIGYMAENFEAITLQGKSKEIKRSNPERIMTLLVAFPNSKEFENEILKIDEFMSHIQIEINCYALFAAKEDCHIDGLKKFETLFDSEQEFGGMYGATIEDGSLEGKLTKSLFLIGKDGSIFWLDVPQDLSNELDLERLQVELNRAYVSYTGVGCH